MTQAAAAQSSVQTAKLSRDARLSTLGRLAKYSGSRLVVLFFTVVVGIYLTILIANMGGYVDEIRKGTIRESISISVSLNKTYQNLTVDQRRALVTDLVAIEEGRLGLDQPFAIRSVGFLKDALTLNLGRADYLTSDSGSKLVRLIILERLPPTLLLMGASQLLLFIVSIFAALALSRSYGSLADRLVIALAPTGAAPGWFYGLFLILIFAGFLRVLPFGGMVDAPPPSDPTAYAISLVKHMILPVLALVLSSGVLTIYNWRTFFLIYSSEDYVDMAKAKGLPDRMIESRYILRPTLPTIITNFALILISLWTGAIILETVFNWPGLGRLNFRAINLYDTPVIVGIAIIYAYLLAITVFLLDFVYALVDPRVKVGGNGGAKA